MTCPLVQPPGEARDPFVRVLAAYMRAFLGSLHEAGAVPTIYPDIGTATISVEDGESWRRSSTVRSLLARHGLLALAHHFLHCERPALERLIEGARFEVPIDGSRRATVIVRLASCEEAAARFAERLESPDQEPLTPEEASRLAAVLRTLSARVGDAR